MTYSECIFNENDIGRKIFLSFKVSSFSFSAIFVNPKITKFIVTCLITCVTSMISVIMLIITITTKQKLLLLMLLQVFWLC